MLLILDEPTAEPADKTYSEGWRHSGPDADQLAACFAGMPITLQEFEPPQLYNLWLTLLGCWAASPGRSS